VYTGGAEGKKGTENKEMYSEVINHEIQIMSENFLQRRIQSY
jgi:hypothetical protein